MAVPARTTKAPSRNGLELAWSCAVVGMGAVLTEPSAAEAEMTDTLLINPAHDKWLRGPCRSRRSTRDTWPAVLGHLCKRVFCDQGCQVIDLLRQVLVVREAVQKAAEIASEYGYLESLPELKQIDSLERAAFEKVNEWDKPS